MGRKKKQTDIEDIKIGHNGGPINDERKKQLAGDRALELYEKGIKPEVIEQRLGVRASHLQAMLQQARARREKACEVAE